jgi:hypothetical protein
MSLKPQYWLVSWIRKLMQPQPSCVRDLHVQLGNVYGVCMCEYSVHIHEVVSTKPATPEQARIKAMQAQVKQAQQRMKAERIRQQQVKLNQARAAVSSSV